MTLPPPLAPPPRVSFSRSSELVFSVEHHSRRRERRVERLLLRGAEGDAGVDRLEAATQSALGAFGRMLGEERLHVALRRRVAERPDRAGHVAQRRRNLRLDLRPVRLMADQVASRAAGLNIIEARMRGRSCERVFSLKT